MKDKLTTEDWDTILTSLQYGLRAKQNYTYPSYEHMLAAISAHEETIARARAARRATKSTQDE